MIRALVCGLESRSGTWSQPARWGAFLVAIRGKADVRCSLGVSPLWTHTGISNWSEVSWRSFPRLHRDQPSGSSLGAQPSVFSLVANAFQRGGREDFEDVAMDIHYAPSLASNARFRSTPQR